MDPTDVCKIDSNILLTESWLVCYEVVFRTHITCDVDSIGALAPHRWAAGV